MTTTYTTICYRNHENVEIKLPTKHEDRESIITVA